MLDDNKMLCLPNGERIKLPNTVTMMFEVQDLAVASPATVSRCGMVYLDECTSLLVSTPLFVWNWKYSLSMDGWVQQCASLPAPCCDCDSCLVPLVLVLQVILRMAGNLKCAP